MAYSDIASAAESDSLRRRTAAAGAQEHVPGDPWEWSWDQRFQLAAQPGWGEAWASAAAGGNPDPGADPGVITDGMILSGVQAVLAGG